ncbi:hypothetical protein M3Y94_01308900 [Aphelenchoides besseyi]|nr:hypothetical protein M3Y94_01308900 [Aphelenchoides besseyi]KAI6220253.1 hypothetical protein M3Y95_01065400 [Aphelenchoides besseyi]
MNQNSQINELNERVQNLENELEKLKIENQELRARLLEAEERKSAYDCNVGIRKAFELYEAPFKVKKQSRVKYWKAHMKNSRFRNNMARIFRNKITPQKGLYDCLETTLQSLYAHFTSRITNLTISSCSGVNVAALITSS